MPNGYDPSAFPNSYKDPAYDQADQVASAALGIPAQLLTNIRTKGEKSNADQISSAGAATPYQITASTRQSILGQTGVDPWLNPNAAAYGAAYLLKQSMDRNGGNPVQAVTEYVGGTDPKAWGPATMAYTKRVTGFTPASYQPGSTPNPFQVQPLPGIGSAPGSVGSTPSGSSSGGDPYAVQALPDIGAGPGANSNAPSALTQAYQAYQSGKMAPEDASRFEQDVNAGRIVLPAGMDVKAPQPQPEQPGVMPMAPQQVVDAFNSGQMQPQDAAQFQKDIASNNIALPPGATLNPPQASAGRTAGVAARGFMEGLGQGIGGVVDRAKGIIDAPMNAVNAIAGGQNPLSAVDSAIGTHLAPQPQAQPAAFAGAPNAAGALPSMEQSADPIANRLGLPVAQTPGEQQVQAGARGAGAMVQPFPGASLRALPAMIAAGAAGGSVGEAVHQHTGSQALGLAANLITTALSPVAASRVMQALVGEIGARNAAAGVSATEGAEPTMQASTQEAPAAQGAAPTPGAEAQPSAPLGTQINPGTPQVTNPDVAALQQEKAGLLPIAANAPAKGDTSIQDQLGALAGRTFDTVQDRTRALQAQGMKFQDARAAAQKQIDGEMTAYQDQLGSLQNQLGAAQAGSRAAQRIQEIDDQIAQLGETAPAQRTPIASAVSEAMRPTTARTPEATAPEAAQPAESAPALAGTSEAPPLQPGMVRMYHGGLDMENPTSRWVSDDQRYAQGYADKSGGAGRVFYTDIPETDPRLQKSFDDSGTGQRAPYVPFELRDQEAAQMKPLGTQPTAAAGQTEGIGATPLVPDDPEQRAQIISLMQNASGQNKTISAVDVQAARNELLARFKIDPQAVDSARDLGMLDDLHPDHLATDIQMIKLNQLLKSDPSNPMAAQEAANLTRVGQRAIGLFNEMGAAPDISALSQKANQMLGEQNNSLKGDVHNILDNQIPSMVPKNSQVPATNSLAMINDELANLGGKSQLLSRDWRRAQGLLSPVDEPVSIGGQQVPGSKVGIAPTNPTYHAVDTLRKQLNAADRGVGPFVNMEQASRRRLAQTLSQDQGAYLQSASPEAHALWQQANAKVQMYKAVQDDMQTLFGKSTEQSMLPTMKNAIQGLSSGNVENFNRVVSAIPKSMRNEVLTSTLQNMFTRAGANELGPFGFEQFSRFFKSFKQDSASMNALMGNLDPETRSTLSKLINVSDRISGSISQKIYTGRSRFAKDLVAELNDVPTTVIDRMRSAIGPAAGRVIGGAVAGAAHKVPVVGPAVLGPVAHGVGNFAAWAISPNKTPVEKALSDFIVSDDAKDILSGGPKVTDQQVKAASNSPTFRSLYNLARGDAANDPTTRERWLRGMVNAAGQVQQNNR